MADSGQLTRRVINDKIGDLRTMLRWAVQQRYLPASALAGAQAVPYLKRGRSNAPESEPIEPATYEQVATVAPYAGPVVEAMIWFQWHTAARPGEVCILRPCDVSQDEDCWRYRPFHHKTAHHGKDRIIRIGPQAQAWLAPFLRDRDPEAFCFSPAEAEAQRRADQRNSRKSYESCGNRPGTNRRTNPKRQPRQRYTTLTYGRAVRYACEAAIPPPEHLQRQARPAVKRKLTREERTRYDLMQRIENDELSIEVAAGVLEITYRQTKKILARYREHGKAGVIKKRPGPQPTRNETWAEWSQRIGEAGWRELQAFRKENHFSPNQLRHAAATIVRQQYGLEAAQIVLGHAKRSTTEIYAEPDTSEGERAIRGIG